MEKTLSKFFSNEQKLRKKEAEVKELREQQQQAEGIAQERALADATALEIMDQGASLGMAGVDQDEYRSKLNSEAWSDVFRL